MKESRFETGFCFSEAQERLVDAFCMKYGISSEEFTMISMAFAVLGRLGEGRVHRFAFDLDKLTLKLAKV